MPQEWTSLLNKTIHATGQNAAAAPPDSLSLRITGLAKGAYVEIDGIAWGIVGGLDADLTAFDFGDLLILKNEVFDAAFTYTLANSARKDVIWNDAIIRGSDLFKTPDFSEPIKLNDAANYLIVMPAPIVVGTPATPFNCSLCVRGRICNTSGAFASQSAPAIGDEKQR